MKKKSPYFFLIATATVFSFFNTNSSFSQSHYDFAVYTDNHNDLGAWGDDVIAFEHFLSWKGLTHNRVTASDINTITLKNIYKAIYFPGGDSDYYEADINSIGMQHIRDMIADSGAYIGTCAGAEFACDKLIWQGITYNRSLGLFQGTATGPIDSLAVWPNYAMTTVTMNLGKPINQLEPLYAYGANHNKEDMLYYGGSVFKPYAGTKCDTIATFDGYFNKPAIVSFDYGTGRVLLIAPHPEIEEDDPRDGVNVAKELNDNGSDWPFLCAATDWLFRKPVICATLTDVNSLSSLDQIVTIYPNPTANRITLSKQNNDLQAYNLSVKNMIGKEIFNEKISFSNSYVVDLKKFENGIYFLTLQNDYEQIVKKVVVEK